MFRQLTAAALMTLGLCGASLAQDPKAAGAAPAAPAVATPAVPVAGAAGVQSANIFEIGPDAESDPNYAKQTNGERAKVQPGNNAPIWRQVGGGVTGFSSLPKSEAPEAGNLIQPFVQYPGSRFTNAGEAWRQVRNNWLIPYGGALLLIVLGAIGLFYWRVGTIKLHGKPTGRKIERFTPFERSAHWANAIAFSILAISGLVMAFGQFLLLPIIGAHAVRLADLCAQERPQLRRPGVRGVAGDRDRHLHPRQPAGQGRPELAAQGRRHVLGDTKSSRGRFNAGEKVVFWGGVFVLGLVVVASGLVLDKLVPGLVYERSTMQIAHMVHSVSNILMLVMFMGHIYLGTLGTEGAIEGMKTGYVDETWAREHHELWYDDVKSGRIPAQRSPQPAPGPTVQV